jgi:hemolysin activation/secretion protein
VDVSNFARLGAWIAPEAFGYDNGGVGALAQLRLGAQVSRGFAWFDVRANGLITGAGVDSGSVVAGATAVMVPWRKHMIIGHADIGWIKDPVPAQEFDLGFASGPRAFPIHAFTGDRAYFATAEYRYQVAEDLIKLLDLGVATFADHGGAWWHYDSKRTGSDVGIGLRLSASRAADANPTRLDLAYRFDNDVQKSGWVFVIASGLVFNTNPRGGF